MVISEDDTIVTAWAEKPLTQWSYNALVWVLVRDKRGQLRIEDLQPGEQDAAVQTLFRISLAVHMSMSNAVRSCVEKADHD